MKNIVDIITSELLAKVSDHKAKGKPLYPPIDAAAKFHAAYDGTKWKVFQNEEGDVTNDLTDTPMNVIYSCDWDGSAPYVTTTDGTFPGKIPFYGWPQTDVKP